MSYKEDFTNADGWSAADVSIRLNNTAGKAFLTFLRGNGVDTIIRYYATSNRPKTITPEEAKFLSKEGFGILLATTQDSLSSSQVVRKWNEICRTQAFGNNLRNARQPGREVL